MPTMQGMLLHVTAVYGLRALAVLASLDPGASLNAAALADRTGVPQQYLSKVMRKLVVARLVRSRRGHGGGFQLQRAPGSIRVADALAALDFEVGTGCAFGFPACNLRDPCILHPLWSQLQQSLQQWTGGCTFGDLATKHHRSRNGS
jgi:Rrf2 family protein